MNKKQLFSFATLLFSSSLLFDMSAAPEILAYNSQVIMSKAKEVQALQKTIDEKQQAIQEELYNTQQALKARAEKLNPEKQSLVLNNDAIRKQEMALGADLRKFKRDQEAKSQELQIEMKQEEMLLIQKLEGYAEEICKERKGNYIIDVATPGIKLVNKQVDITDEVLKMADAKFEALSKKSDVKAEPKKA